MILPDRIGIASRNPGKIREVLAICSDWPVTWVTADDPSAADWPDVEETGSTYLDNCLLKGRAIAAVLGAPVLADDSGIEVDALGGGPGVRSARFAGEGASDQENLDALIKAISGIPSGGRTARYRCLAALVYPDGTEVHAEGGIEGMLLTAPIGAGGFGYDPIFVPEGREVTMAQLTPEEKDRISHRGRAFRALTAAVLDAGR